MRVKTLGQACLRHVRFEELCLIDRAASVRAESFDTTFRAGGVNTDVYAHKDGAKLASAMSCRKNCFSAGRAASNRDGRMRITTGGGIGRFDVHSPTAGVGHADVYAHKAAGPSLPPPSLSEEPLSIADSEGRERPQSRL